MTSESSNMGLTWSTEAIIKSLRALLDGSVGYTLLDKLGTNEVIRLAIDRLEVYSTLAPESTFTAVEMAEIAAGLELLKRYQELGTLEEVRACMKNPTAGNAHG